MYACQKSLVLARRRIRPDLTPGKTFLIANCGRLMISWMNAFICLSRNVSRLGRTALRLADFPIFLVVRNIILTGITLTAGQRNAYYQQRSGNHPHRNLREAGVATEYESGIQCTGE